MKGARLQLAQSVATMGGIAVAGLAGPANADDFAARLFGRAPGQGATYACFQRVYDEAHLQSHPQQNVRAMLVLAKIDSDVPDSYDIRIGSYFRKLRDHLETEGSCGMVAAQGEANGGKTIHCGIACDGGSIDVALKDNASILIGIPERARLWKPGSDDPSAGRGAFGADDKLFRVDRVSAAQCLPLAADAAERKAIARAK